MKMRKFIVLFVAFLCITGFSFAQDKSNYGNVPLTKVAPTYQKSSNQQLLLSALKASSGNEFRLIKTEQDKVGGAHYTYQQYYNTIKVEFGVLKIHEKNGLKTAYNGAFFNTNGLRTSGSVSSQQVNAIAKSYMGSTDVFWLSEKNLASKTASDPEVLILPNRKTKELNLVYAVNIGVSSPKLKMGTVYVDANTGKVLKYKNRLFNCFEGDHITHEEHNTNEAPLATGGGYAAYTGFVNFETKLDGSDYVLNDETRATGSSWNLSTQGLGTKTGIITVDLRNGTDYVNGPVYEFSDDDNNWSAAEMIVDDNVYAMMHIGEQK